MDPPSDASSAQESAPRASQELTEGGDDGEALGGDTPPQHPVEVCPVALLQRSTCRHERIHGRGDAWGARQRSSACSLVSRDAPIGTSGSSLNLRVRRSDELSGSRASPAGVSYVSFVSGSGSYTFGIVGGHQPPTRRAEMPPKKGSKNASKNASKNVSRAASGTATPVQKQEPQKSAPALVGINFGNSFSSIAVINKVRSSCLLSCFGSEGGSEHRRALRTALPMTMASARSPLPSRTTAPKRCVPRRCSTALAAHSSRAVHWRASSCPARP